MTRKDYIVIADILRQTRNAPFKPQEVMQTCDLMAEMFAVALAADNPRFDKQHFLAVARGQKPLVSRPNRKAASNG
jgi:hypothetical protein